MGNACCRVGKNGTRVSDLEMEAMLESSRVTKVTTENRFARPCRRCLLSCVCILAFYLVLLAFASLVSFLLPMPETCAVEDFPLEPVPQPFPMRLGTEKTVARGMWPFAEIDLTGVWWIRWSNSESTAVRRPPGTLLSFADSERILGGSVEDPSANGFYPMVLRMATQTPLKWGFRDSRALLAPRLRTAVKWDKHGQLTFAFINRTFARINNDMELVKRDEDVWAHHNETSPGLAFTLTRVIDKTGQPVQTWWPAFVDYMGPHNLRIWGDDNHCKRRCELSVRSFFVPPSPSCKICNQFC